jgi:predicted ester cyclase
MPLLDHPPLTSNNDMSKTEESLAVVLAMEQALQDASDDMDAHFAADFRWMGNTGCGTKKGVAEFRRNWQLPLRAAFSDRSYHDQARIAQGEWVSAFGYIEATHSGEFMGIAPTRKRVRIKYVDFWKVENGKIADNWVSVDFAHILQQLGVDVFRGEGWEKFDNGRSTPPVPSISETEPSTLF